jgi:hypothetical protein
MNAASCTTRRSPSPFQFSFCERKHPRPSRAEPSPLLERWQSHHRLLPTRLGSRWQVDLVPTQSHKLAGRVLVRLVPATTRGNSGVDLPRFRRGSSSPLIRRLRSGDNRPCTSRRYGGAAGCCANQARQPVYPSRGETALVCRRQRTRSSPITRSTLDSHSDLLVAAIIDLGPHRRPITC